MTSRVLSNFDRDAATYELILSGIDECDRLGV